MGVSVFPAPSAASKTMFRTTLTSGTSYTVPAGVTYLNVTLVGGGGGGGGGYDDGAYNRQMGNNGNGGQIISSTLSVTAGASITYAIGAGGTAAASSTSFTNNGGAGGSTTFTGATTAAGGNGGTSAFNGTAPVGTAALVSPNHGNSGPWGSSQSSAAGGAGAIYIEYWV